MGTYPVLLFLSKMSEEKDSSVVKKVGRITTEPSRCLSFLY
jgi:hypothetical protein